MMESEIQFLLGLVLNHKLNADVRKLCLERIGLIEQTLRTNPPPARPPAQVSTVNPSGQVIQAPSTQRLLEQAGPIPGLQPQIPQGARDKETGLINVVTSTTAGGSTRGPSKVFR